MRLGSIFVFCDAEDLEGNLCKCGIKALEETFCRIYCLWQLVLELAPSTSARTAFDPATLLVLCKFMACPPGGELVA